MDELEKNLPDDFWRKTFEDASETPPSRVWAGIEQRLDESNGSKVLPLWGTGLASSRPVMWSTGLAATVALLLIGWWVSTKTTESTTQSLAQVQHINTHPHRPDLNSADQSQNSSAPSTAKVGNGSIGTLATTAKPLARTIQPSNSSGSVSMPTVGNQETVAQTARKLLSDVNPNVTFPAAAAQGPLQTTTFANNRTARQFATASYSVNGRSGMNTNEIGQKVTFNLLSGTPLRMRRPGTIQRIVWARPAELGMEPELVQSKHHARELWASVSMMPGSFNPLVSVRAGQVATSMAATSQSPVNSRANFSVAYQAGAGLKLTEHWSVESGIGYLSGHSTVETVAQNQFASTSKDIIANSYANTNTYVDAVRNSLSQKGNAQLAAYNNLPIASLQAPAVYDNRQTITNNYEYVQVPVQVGYQIRPRKKLSIAVLGGILTNIFVRNTVGDELVVTSKDGVYRPLSLAATMGARLRYRPSRQWSASLAGVYQPSLEAGTKADSQVQAHPTSTGMSFGLDYHF